MICNFTRHLLSHAHTAVSKCGQENNTTPIHTNTIIITILPAPVRVLCSLDNGFGIDRRSSFPFLGSETSAIEKVKKGKTLTGSLWDCQC